MDSFSDSYAGGDSTSSQHSSKRSQHSSKAESIHKSHHSPNRSHRPIPESSNKSQRLGSKYSLPSQYSSRQSSGSNHSDYSRISNTSALSDASSAKLRALHKRIKYEELQRQLEEDEAADKELQIIDDQARKARLQAEEIERNALRDRENLTKKLSRRRRLRIAQQEMVEAKAISTLVDDTSIPLEDTQAKAPTPAPKTTSHISPKPDLPRSAEDSPPLPSSPITVPSPSEPPVPTVMDLLVTSSHGLPKPTLPKFSDGKERDFALLKMAL